MDKKCLKVKIFLNFFGTYKEVSLVADISTTDKPIKPSHQVLIFSCKHALHEPTHP